MPQPGETAEKPRFPPSLLAKEGNDMDNELFSPFSLFGLPVTLFALLMTAALAIGLGVFFLCGKKAGCSGDALWRTALLSLPLGLIGARLFYCMGNVYLYEEIGLDAALRLWEGGYALWGAVGGAALAAFLSGRMSRVPVSGLLDAAAPAGALMIAAERFLESLTGEGMGPYVEAEFFCRFPFAVYRADYEVWNWAVFLLEGAVALVVTAVLLRKKRPAGDTARLFLLLYSACQITLESLRRDHCLRWLFVRVSQLTALLVILGLMAAGMIRWAKNRQTRLISGKRLAADWALVALFSAVIVGIEFSFDGKILRDLPVWAGYLAMVCCCCGIGLAAGNVIFKSADRGMPQAE